MSDQDRPNANAEATVNQTVLQIPNGPAVNFLIGTRGSTVTILEQACGCRIDVQKIQGMATQDAQYRTVTITHSDPDRRAVCAKLVQYKIEEFQESGKRASVSDAADESAAKRIRALTAANDARMKHTLTAQPPAVDYAAAQAAAGMMHVPVGAMMPYQLPALSGSPLFAAQQLSPLVFGTDEASGTQTVLEIPNGPLVNFLIGSKGSTVSALEQASGCRIDVQKVHDMTPGSMVRKVTISSNDAARRAHCVSLVQQKVAECPVF